MPISDITTIKTHCNSVISTEKARYLTLNISNFYLEHELDEYKYIFWKKKLLPIDLIEQYDLKDKIYNGKIYTQIRKGMYRLPQAGTIVYKGIVKYLKPYGF